jgi:hypothetical protein
MDSNFDFQPQIPETIEEWKSTKLSQLIAEKNFRLDKLILSSDGQTPRSQGETLTWKAKVTQAKKFMGSGDLEDCPILVIEMTAFLKEDAAHEPEIKDIESGVKQLAQRLIGKEPQMESASAYIVGRAGRLEEVINSLETIEELQQLNLAEGWD